MGATHCPSNDKLQDYFGRRLPPAVAAEIAAHIDACEACRTVVVVVVRSVRGSSALGR